VSRQWTIDFDDLPNKLNKNTGIIMLNSPHNPTGKIFTEEEQLKLSAIFDEFAPNAIVINDVVYENVVFDNNKFVRFANVKDNWRRTVTVYSAGKMMSCTGWKIGWLIGPSELIRACAIVNESIAFQTNTICQLAVAKSLPIFDKTPSYGYPNYSAYLTDQFTKCRDILVETFSKSSLGLVPLHAEGGYFLMADATNLRKHIDPKYFTTDHFSEGLEDVEYKRFPGKDQPAYDYVASRFLALKAKVAPMPVSLFYTDDSFDEKYLRFAICQTTDTINEARKRIEAAEEWLKKD
jgi:aspartate/methionine/tyrosine aminotransferase